jgi:hypothetical protein
LEVEDASHTSAALITLQRWVEKVVEKEVARTTAKCQRHQDRQGYVLHWVERGMGERLSRAEQLEHRIQTLLGIFSAKGALPLEFKPANSVGDLLTQHLDELKQEAERKGGVLQTLSEHFAKVYKMPRLVPAAERPRTVRAAHSMRFSLAGFGIQIGLDNPSKAYRASPREEGKCLATIRSGFLQPPQITS